MNITVSIAGPEALLATIEAADADTASAWLQAACDSVERAFGSALVDLVPAYATLLVIYDPLQLSHVKALARLRTLLDGVSARVKNNGREVMLPVYYAPESGRDLESVAQTTGLTVDEVINLHCATAYRVRAVGFAPGFAYLGDIDERLSVPRLSTPRLRVPRGSVAIAERQTAVYPAESPGGWHLLGLCPVALFDPARSPPMPVAIGDTVNFHAVSRAEFLRLGGTLS